MFFWDKTRLSEIRSTSRNELYLLCYFGGILGKTESFADPSFFDPRTWTTRKRERADRSFKVDKAENRSPGRRGLLKNGGLTVFPLCEGETTAVAAATTVAEFGGRIRDEIPARSGKIRADFHGRATRNKKAATRRGAGGFPPGIPLGRALSPCSSPTRKCNA